MFIPFAKLTGLLGCQNLVMAKRTPYSKTAIKIGTWAPTNQISMELKPLFVGASTELYVLIIIKYKVIRSPILPGTESGHVAHVHLILCPLKFSKINFYHLANHQNQMVMTFKKSQKLNLHLFYKINRHRRANFKI